jgi:septal ring factor EnvC (AmiA/AmiB activator)
MPDIVIPVFLAAAAAWLAVTALRAVVGEYVKRVWFNRIHPDEITTAKRALAAAMDRLKADQEEFSAFKDHLASLIEDNNLLQAEISRLRRENAQLVLALKPSSELPS